MNTLTRTELARTRNNVHLLDLKPKVEDFEAAVVHGLSADPKAIPPKFFYDAKGSELFNAICDTPEYYVTRTELALLDRIGPEVAALAGPHASVIEFGCGSSDKIRKLLTLLDRPTDYVAIDISREQLLQSADEIAIEFEDVHVSAICADFAHRFQIPKGFCSGTGRRLAFFPGSTIGNQTPEEALEFLKIVHETVAPDGALLIGVDLRKDVARLNAAYNDSAGVTAAFNLNLLHRMKGELGAKIDPAAFTHHAFFNEALSRIEMHLVSQKVQTVRVNGSTFAFAKGESIHTECSYKYDIEQFRRLTEKAGFRPRHSWTDENRLFSIHFLEA
jgi:dimethylhistidine N-methyltransferase